MCYCKWCYYKEYGEDGAPLCKNKNINNELIIISTNILYCKYYLNKKDFLEQMKEYKENYYGIKFK